MIRLAGYEVGEFPFMDWQRGTDTAVTVDLLTGGAATLVVEVTTSIIVETEVTKAVVTEVETLVDVLRRGQQLCLAKTQLFIHNRCGHADRDGEN